MKIKSIRKKPALRYLSMYPAFCALVSEICVCPEMLRVFRYTDVLTCVIYNCTRLNSRDDWSSDSSAVKIIGEDR